jgi:anti-sigma factor RsiW
MNIPEIAPGPASQSANEQSVVTVMDVRCLDDASYVLGALTPAERRVFQRHLGLCSRCQASVRQLTRVQWLLGVTEAHAHGQPPRP